MHLYKPSSYLKIAEEISKYRNVALILSDSVGGDHQIYSYHSVTSYLMMPKLCDFNFLSLKTCSEKKFSTIRQSEGWEVARGGLLQLSLIETCKMFLKMEKFRSA